MRSPTQDRKRSRSLRRPQARPRSHKMAILPCSYSTGIIRISSRLCVPHLSSHVVLLQEFLPLCDAINPSSPFYGFPAELRRFPMRVLPQSHFVILWRPTRLESGHHLFRQYGRVSIVIAVGLRFVKPGDCRSCGPIARAAAD
jgi:hypothetical protein